MLDTRIPPISTRTRRSHSSARSEARPSASPRLESRSQAVRVQTEAEPIRRSLPSARTSRLARSEMKLMGLATVCTAVVCALLLLYLAAYARVTQLGIAQSQVRKQLRQAQIRNELLQAQRNSLESPQRIAAAALALGMTPRGATPINYIVARSVPAQPPLEGLNTKTAEPSGVEVASGREQGNRIGTTEDSGAAASGSH